MLPTQAMKAYQFYDVQLNLAYIEVRLDNPVDFVQATVPHDMVDRSQVLAFYLKVIFPLADVVHKIHRIFQN